MFTFQDRKKCQAFAESLKGNSPVLVRLWDTFLQKAFAATRGPYVDDDAHRDMVTAADSFKRCFLEATLGDKELLRRMPQGISLIGSRMSMGMPQHTAAREIIEALEYNPEKKGDASMTPLPDSGTRVKKDAPPPSRRMSAAS